MRDQVIPFLAVEGSFPVAPAMIYISPDMISAKVTTVPINKVADKMISWTKRPTEVSCQTLFLIPRVS